MTIRSIRPASAAMATILAALALVLCADGASAQAVSVEGALSQPSVRTGLEYIDEHRQETADFLRIIGGIGAPSWSNGLLEAC